MCSSTRCHDCSAGGGIAIGIDVPGGGLTGAVSDFERRLNAIQSPQGDGIGSVSRNGITLVAHKQLLDAEYPNEDVMRDDSC